MLHDFPDHAQITSSVLYMPMITPPSLKSKASIRDSALPSDGVKTSSNLPGLVTTRSVALY